MKRRPSPQRILWARTLMVLAAISLHRRRVGVFALIGACLAWLVATTTLPYALAERMPRLALWLDPQQPVALMVMANNARAALLELPAVRGTAKATEIAKSSDKARGNPQPMVTVITGAAPDANAAARDALRAQIRALAIRAIASDPFNARPYRLLAELTDDPARVRRLMQAAVKRSRRESVAVFWLLNDSFKRADYDAVVQNADILMRTRQQLTPYVVKYLSDISMTPEGREVLAAHLARRPRWRATFFEALPQAATGPADMPLALMLALKEAGSPPPQNEFAPYLNVLVSKNMIDLAYNSWLQLMPEEKLGAAALLNNASFATDPSGLPFDWSIKHGQNTVVEFVDLRDAPGERALRFGFGLGRVRFPEISQVVLLPAGRYRLEGAFQGAMAARRGLRWEVGCTGTRTAGTKTPLVETEMIYGHPRAWQSFTLDLQVPDRADCRAQRLRLFHHSRSPSEELISGEIMFRGLRLARATQ